MSILSNLRPLSFPRFLSLRQSSSLVLTTTDSCSGISTLKFNDPARLNAWSMPMMKELQDSMAKFGSNPSTKAVILTGSDPYFCSGVQLSSLVKFQHPGKLHRVLEQWNRSFMEIFLLFPKPVVVAMNGPAIGAAVTTSALADILLVSEKATLSTPFNRLGIMPEGCSSINFPRIMGRENARRMLREDWTPNAEEAMQIGLAKEVVRHDQLLKRAHELALTLVDKPRWFQKEEGLLERLKEANNVESKWLADAALSKPFLMEQQRFVARKGKNKKMANMLYLLAATRPLWGLMLPKPTPVHLDF